MQTSSTKWTFIAEHLRSNPETTYPEAESLYHRQCGFSEAEAAHLQQKRELEITRLKTLIDTGHYRRDGQEIAEKMLSCPEWQERVNLDRRLEYERRRDDFQQEAGMRQDAGVVSPPSPELFGLAPSPDPPQNQSGRLSIWEISLLALVVLVCGKILYEMWLQM
jgi:hypothetical protein